MYQRCKKGRFSVPVSTRMVSPCQATFTINLFQQFVMAYALELRLAEECTRAYKLKDRHSMILALKNNLKPTDVTKDRSAGRQGGGNVLLALLYTTGGQTGSIAPVIQSGLLICEHCVQVQTHMDYSGVGTCLRHTLQSEYREVVQNGQAIVWATMPIDYRPME